MTTRRRTTADQQVRADRAMLAGCNSVTDQFFRFRAGIMAELAACPDDDTATQRRERLITALERLNQEIEIMQRIAARVPANHPPDLP